MSVGQEKHGDEERIHTEGLTLAYGLRPKEYWGIYLSQER